MRYLIDTNIFVYMATDAGLLSRDVAAILQEPETVLCMSAESARELVIGFRGRKLYSKHWKTAQQMLAAIEKEFYIQILPLKKEHMLTYASLMTDDAHGHNDPSDHIIISHAITERLPLISSDRRFEFYRKQGLDFVFNKK